MDDMIDTAGTITNAAKALRQEGARQVIACTSHAVFSPPAVERLSSGVFEEVIVTNTIPVAEANQFPALTILRYWKCEQTLSSDAWGGVTQDSVPTYLLVCTQTMLDIEPGNANSAP